MSTLLEAIRRSLRHAHFNIFKGVYQLFSSMCKNLFKRFQCFKIKISFHSIKVSLISLGCFSTPCFHSHLFFQLIPVSKKAFFKYSHESRVCSLLRLINQVTTSTTRKVFGAPIKHTNTFFTVRASEPIATATKETRCVYEFYGINSTLFFELQE